MIELNWDIQPSDEELLAPESKLEAYQIAVSDLADRNVQEAMANGDAFSEALCNWAISEAERIIPKP